MTTVLPLTPARDAPALADDLAHAGLNTLPPSACDKLVRDALRQSPDLIVCWDDAPAEGLLAALELLAATAPLPVLVFTRDASVESMQRALRAGVQEWVVNGYARERLRSLAQLARERFAHLREMREALADVEQRFEERKRVERAKGLLMRASQMSEEEAFRRLRQASMNDNRRVGQVAQDLIDAAQDNEALNLAGQLRMLSQRIVKLVALGPGDDAPPDTAALLAASLERAAHNLDTLTRLLSRPTFGDLVDALRADWKRLRGLLAADAPPELSVLDAQAETCLRRADRLVGVLEAAGTAPTLRVVNLSGRQRMLSQRVAKRALLGVLNAKDDEAVVEFEQAMHTLRQLPLTTREIAAALDAASGTWSALLAAARRAQHADGRRVLAKTSEALLETFERLTEAYARSLDIVIGPR
jgi:AmiR/NasT family two-component response regulator